ncbi:MAG: hypothetical protein JRI74_11090 [Deltaproteobacteria bacterium]|nr:hypothetical protein [Deltaproteobacteria bacterium]
MKNPVRWFAGTLFISLFFLGCTSVVRTDLESLSDSSEWYSIVIVTTEIESVMDNPEAYAGRTVELSGYVKERSVEIYNGWSFILEDARSNSINCYEWEFNDADLTELEIVLRQAMKEDEEITIVGKFEKGQNIELESIEARGQTYPTDKPLWQYE